MVTRKLYREQWRSYFEWISAEAQKHQVDVRLLAEGESVAHAPTTLQRLVYDAASDLLEVCTRAVDHVIPQPARIYVDEYREAVTSIEVVQSNGSHHLIRLGRPVSLPKVDD